MHVLAVEYPGYGVYTSNDGENEDENTTAEKIIRDAETVYQFITQTL